MVALMKFHLFASGSRVVVSASELVIWYLEVAARTRLAVLRGSLQPLLSLQTFLCTVRQWLFSEAWNILLVWKALGMSSTVTVCFIGFKILFKPRKVEVTSALRKLQCSAMAQAVILRPQHGGPNSIHGRSMWDLWWTVWHWDSFSFQGLSRLPWQVIHQRSVFIRSSITEAKYA